MHRTPRLGVLGQTADGRIARHRINQRIIAFANLVLKLSKRKLNSQTTFPLLISLRGHISDTHGSHLKIIQLGHDRK